MNPTRQLHDVGQSLWLDNITRELLTSSTLERYIGDYALTGLTSNPTIFDHALRASSAYDDAIRARADKGLTEEALFVDLALEDLERAADLFRPAHESSGGVDGWVSLEVSPLLAHDTARTVKSAQQLHARAKRRNLFIKIPGTPEGMPAIEEAVFAGVPINVTLLFSREQYLAAAEAYRRGIERRIVAGLDPDVASVASLFVSRWDVAVADKVPPALHNRLGIAIAKRTYKAYRELMASPPWQKIVSAGGKRQRLLWASTSTKDPNASDVLYIEALAAPGTINTMPDKTLKAYADHGQVKQILPDDGGDAERLLAEFTRAGVDDAAIARELLREGTRSFDQSWRDLMDCIFAKRNALSRSRAR